MLPLVRETSAWLRQEPTAFSPFLRLSGGRPPKESHLLDKGIGVPVRHARMLVLRPQYGLPGHSGTHLTLVPLIVNDCFSAGIGRNV